MLRPHLSRGRLVSALAGKTVDPPPIWLMRQAGRYLPEYRNVRAKAGSFLDLCLNPALAAEVTLQPLRRFDLDAAIVFSDILMVPHALGQKVEFIEGEGPKLAPLRHAENLARLDPVAAERRFAPVYETLRASGRDSPTAYRSSAFVEPRGPLPPIWSKAPAAKTRRKPGCGPIGILRPSSNSSIFWSK